jgi:hypothetical protein
VMDNPWDAYRNHIQEQINHQESLLFQRFNYFLLMTSFLMIAFVTIVLSSKFTADLSDNYSVIALVIGIVGFLLSYFFSIINFINVKIIHDIGLFLRKVISSGNINTLPSFGSHVSNKIVPQHRFRIKYFGSVYLNTIAFIFRTTLESPFAKTETAGYMDVAPHTWLTPMLIAFVWTIICSITFIDCSYISLHYFCLPLCWLPSLAITVFSILVGVGIRIYVRLNKGKVKEEGRN